MAKPRTRVRAVESGRKQRPQKKQVVSIGKSGPRKGKAGGKAPGKKSVPKRSVPERIRQYLRDVRHELRRTVWPSRQQVVASSVVVVVILVVFSAYVAVLDFAWLQLIKVITARF